MEQDKISCSILFLMFWGQIGVKFNFFRKMNHFIQRKNTNKKARSLDKVPKLRAFPARSYLSDNCSWLRESANYFMYNISLFLQKENSIIGDT